MMTRGPTHPASRATWRAHLHARPGRRALVAVLLALCAALMLQGLVRAGPPLAFALIGLILANDVLLLVATSNVAELPEGAVDERQEAIRNHAYRLAYRLVMLVSIGLLALIVVLASFGDPIGWLQSVWTNTALVVAVGTSLAQLVSFLPTMILAWSEPDPVGSE
jgi:hypothetical protein